MTLPKFSLALSLLLLGGVVNASSDEWTTTTTTPYWYAASQARSILNRIQSRNLERIMPATNTNTEEEEGRHLSAYSKASQSRSFTKLQKHQPPSNIDILNSLSDYDKFWIEIKSDPDSYRSGPCVWSECAIDDVDDAYTGDNRDGDGSWYQYRTQSFCANAGYSLYGRKKNSFWGKLGGKTCTSSHFINSFFTYGGSDMLLQAVGKSPEVFYGGDSNADCVADESGNGDYSTMGCAASGKFIIGYFEGNSCDGNYFVGGNDGFSRYNSAIAAVNCHEMDMSVDYSALFTLLSDSWACDVAASGVSCPDPFQRKGYYEYALQTAANGGNPIRAYNHLVWKDELRFFSWCLFVIAGLIFFAAFSIKQCAIKKNPEMPEDQLSPSASTLTVGSTKFELEDGGKLDNIMTKVSAKTLSAAAWLQWKVGLGKEPEYTFQTSSSPEKNGGADGYESPKPKNMKPVKLVIERSLTPSTVRRLDILGSVTDESNLEMAPTSSVELCRTTTSPQGRVLDEGGGEDKPWVTMNAPRQSLQ